MKVVSTRIRVRILSIVLLAVIPAIGLIYYSADVRKRQTSEEIEANALRLSRFLASNLERDIQQGQGFLRAAAKALDAEILPGDACRSMLAGLLGESSVYANLGVSGPDGRLVCSAAPVPDDTALGRLEWFQKASQPGSLAVGFDFKGVVSPQASINLGMALPAGRHLKAGHILFAVMNLDWIVRLAEKAQLPEGSALSVSNRHGDAVARYPDPDKWVGKPYPRDLIPDGSWKDGEGVRIAKGIDGVERLYAFANVKGKGGFMVHIGIRREAVHAPANRVLFNQMLALGLVSLLAILAAWFGADLFLLKQVNALIDATRRLSSGDLAARSALSYDHGELGELARVFDEMAEQLEWREAQLRESEIERANPTHQVQELLEMIPEAAALLDQSLRVEAANRPFLLLFGLKDLEDTVDVGIALTRLCPELSKGRMDAYISAGGTPSGLAPLRITCRRKDGANLPLELSLSSATLNRRPMITALLRSAATVPPPETNPERTVLS